MPQLKRYDFNVPGGYQYVQPETGMKFDGNTPFKAQVKLISTHRKANSLPRSSSVESAIDLEAYTCSRVPGVCLNGSNRTNSRAVFQRKVGGCASCGGRKK